MSFYYFQESLGLLRDSGSPISMDVWLSSAFLLNFKTSFETDRFDLARDLVYQSPITNQGTTSIYVRFESPLEQVLRMTVISRCPRQAQIDVSRDAFLSHTIDQ